MGAGKRIIEGQLDDAFGKAFLDAVEAELIEYFHGTEVQGLVRLQGRLIASYALARFHRLYPQKGGSKADGN